MAGRPAPDAGFSLIELLIATAIMGTAVITLVTGMATVLNSSSQNRQATTAAIVARDYAEALEVAVAQPGAWCSSSYTVSYTPPSGYSVVPTAGACPADNATTPQFQTVAIVVTGPASATESLTVVVREP
ncbi:MAG TPA: prepilin-type N-terminal cleavage/methylation domain-containing protein [Acidimicrobiia bacterium]|nr:prepilin-type N-terminal cleavage/methylation domain-containing protein [Acidimicrobiia bacterium]